LFKRCFAFGFAVSNLKMAAAGAEGKEMKRAPTAYFLWLGENRAEIAKTLGSAKGSDVSKKGGEMWKALTEQDKAPFVERAAKMKEEYDAKKPPKEEKKKAPAEDLGGRKKPMTPVFAFIQEKREEIVAMPGVKGLGDVSKKGSELYKALPETEKQARQQKFEAEMKSYKEWQQSEEGKQILAGKKSALADKKAAKQEKLDKKQAKLDRKEAREAIARGETPPPPSTPQKRRASAATADRSGAKRGRTSKPATPEAAIDAAILKQASDLGFGNALKNLASRKEVVDSGKTSQEIFQALKKTNGLVNPAKHALLGA